MMKLSKNFSLIEFTESNTAIRNGIDNNPTAEHIHNLVDLCENVLQPLRDRIGSSIRVTSGYRSEALNTAIGGSKTSDHSHGRAADIKLVINGVNISEELYHGIKAMKMQCLKAYKEDNKTKYMNI